MITIIFTLIFILACVFFSSVALTLYGVIDNILTIRKHQKRVNKIVKQSNTYRKDCNTYFKINQ